MRWSHPNMIPLHVRGGDEEMFIPRTPTPEGEPTPWTDTEVVGTSRPRVDAYERVSGSARFTFDVSLPGMLHGAVLRCPHGHARLKRIDTGEAERMPGVHAVITADTPGADIPFFRGRGKLVDRHYRYHGEEVAAVAAASPQVARDALAAIEVEYEVLPHVLDREGATRRGAAILHADEGTGQRRSPGPDNTVHDPEGSYARGDVEAGLAEADHVVEMSFHNDCVIHTPLEVHGTVAQWDGPRLRLWDSSQGVFNVLHAVAATLDIPYANVEVVGDYVGGGFGSKLSIWKHQVLAARLAKLAARPVKLMLTREETFLCVGNRPFTDGVITAGVRNDGTITAIRHTGSSSGGAYPYTNTTGFQSGELYLCDNVDQEETFFLTNAGHGCAMRAPGFPNGAFMTEQVIDELALRIGMDPVEFRLRNVPTFSQRDEERRPYTSTGFAECLRRGAEAFGWSRAKAGPRSEGHVKRGVGVAGGMWAYGGGWPPATVLLKMFHDGTVTIITGASDIGTGTKTVLAMIVAEELGMPVERILIENARTADTPFASASGGSKTLPTEGPAARNAAVDLKRKVLAMAAEHLEVPVGDLQLADEKVSSTVDPETAVTTSDLLRQTSHFDVVGVGYRSPNPERKIIRTWGAHFAEVEVNTRTGKVTVTRLVGANESGRVINRKTFDNQVFGGMTMAIGQGMTEQRVMDAGQTGRMNNATWLDYKVPTAMEVPMEQRVVAVEPVDTECNNTGAKGLGEPAMIPTMAAIANAIHDAVGIRVTRTPMTPVTIMRLLAEKEGAGA